ncbi:MAG: UDP-N-acetylglucosamine 2-epimerase (non-hydrolyzing) [Chitinophagales bacterium]|nr:UDP-N-acetylglucosamine 2-epimerase (non-hydrolyzing) [Chitinophagales bacterium]
MKVVTVIGARPQFIKAAVVSRAFQQIKDCKEIIIHTGQHYDANMSDIFFEEMSIPKPTYQLNIHESLHGAMTAKMVMGIETILIDEKPDFLLVYGDTNSTLAGSIAASKLHVPIAHVEAGLRSFNMKMPEEVNRIVTDRLSKHLFCPTETAIQNLKNEGYDNIDCNIHLTGDVMLDAALYYQKKNNSTILKTLNIAPNNYFLCTIHRAENTNEIGRLSSIINALNELNKQYKVIVPLHPRTVKYIAEYNLKTEFAIIDPVGYFDMLQLIANARMILTDSGGLQKEAFFFHKFCITLRDETEWVELVQNDCNKLVGANEEKILLATQYFLKSNFPQHLSLYGNGRAGDKIAAILNQ